jgi:hypothetical protein
MFNAQRIGMLTWRMCPSSQTTRPETLSFLHFLDRQIGHALAISAERVYTVGYMLLTVQVHQIVFLRSPMPEIFAKGIRHYD